MGICTQTRTDRHRCEQQGSNANKIGILENGILKKLVGNIRESRKFLNVLSRSRRRELSGIFEICECSQEAFFQSANLQKTNVCRLRKEATFQRPQPLTSDDPSGSAGDKEEGPETQESTWSMKRQRSDTIETLDSTGSRKPKKKKKSAMKGNAN